MQTRAYVLTYHSGNIDGNDYATNNLVALADDLEMLRSLAIPIVPLSAVVASLFGAGGSLPERVAAITLDDGLDFDFVDLVHPHHGPQASVNSILARHEQARGARLHATAFVIASPQAREQIADRQMLGYRWIGDHWWHDAVASGRFHIANHSWDHVSPSVDPVGQKERRTGTFRYVDTFDDAELQIRASSELIAAKAPNPGTAFFAYPYGEPSDYVADEYLPMHGKRIGTIAAFTGIPGPLHAGSPRWRLPRYTCGPSWRSPAELARVLRD